MTKVSVDDTKAEQYIAAAIAAAERVYDEPRWVAWAESWLAGTDRTPASARTAARLAGATDLIHYAFYRALRRVLERRGLDEDNPRDWLRMAKLVRRRRPELIPDEALTSAAGATAATHRCGSRGLVGLSALEGLNGPAHGLRTGPQSTVCPGARERCSPLGPRSPGTAC